jgi:SAM-dependent methyltransferase
MQKHTNDAADTLREILFGFRATRLISVAAELGLADLMADTPRGSGELAALTQSDADALHRLLRGLAQIGVFRQDPDGRFGLTPLGECLRSDVPGSQRAFARLLGHDAWWRAWGDLLHSVRTGETAFRHAHGKSLFDYLTDEPSFVPIFNAGMAASSTAVTQAVVAAYDFARFGTIVDVGGGTGSLLTAILRAHRQPRGVLFDLPVSRERAEAAIAAAGLTERCHFVGGDFFAGVPAGGDAYVLKQILHDWDDERSAAVLEQCRQAMAPGGTLLVVEYVLPAGNEPAPDETLMDVTMLVFTGGRERSAAQYAELFGRAGLRLTRVVPTDSPHRIVEGVAA